MVIARLTEVRLLRFRSFRGATVPLGGLTILTGRNSSGKSNVLDAIGVLSRISGGEPLGDALDGGRREGGPVRGGSRGCAPYGETSFKSPPLIDMPGYATAMAGGGLGRVVSQGGLVSAGTQGADDYSGFLRLIGAES